MIYSSTINGIASQEAESLLESVEDRFEYNTIGEATMIVVGEQEANWTKFMTAVGLSELASISEGEEIVYEGVRLQSFIEKAKGWFKVALNKLAEITKSFIAKVDQIFKTNAGFVKKYETELSKYTLPSDFEFKGYKFENKHLDTTPAYPLDGVGVKDVNDIFTKAYPNIKDHYSKEAAEKILFNKENVSGDNYSEKLAVWFYGSKTKEELKGISLKDQLDILKNTKKLKDDAKRSYTGAHKSIKEIIKKLEQAQKRNLNDDKKDVNDKGSMEDAISAVLGFWKSYSSTVVAYHGAYMRALGSRNRQAKAICAKALTTMYKSKGKTDRSKLKKDYHLEGFVNTDAFLGAVEFI